MNDLVSIVIPVYNVEKYLVKNIESVINQSYKNIEIILVNDGSTDTSGDICDKYSQIDERVIVIHKENGGLSSARNRGIDESNGNYISFIDSDDWVDTNYISILYNLVSNYKADIAVGNFECVWSEDEVIVNEETNILVFDNDQALKYLTDKFYLQMVTSWGTLFDRNLFNDLRFKLNKIHEDEFIAHYLYYKSNKTVLTSDKLLYYRQRDDSITSNKFNTRNKVHAIEALKDRVNFLNIKNFEQARNNTYKPLFINYVQLYSEGNETVDKKELFKEIKELKPKLRKSKYDFKFKVAYEAFYLLPTVMKKIISNITIK